MIPYKTKSPKISGTNLKEVNKNVRRIYKKIVANAKRKPFVRSAYFKKEKIFFDYFWDHLKQKNHKERLKRLKYFQAALETIKDSKNCPIIEANPSKKNEIFYRFLSSTKEGDLFYTQIKENKKDNKKYFMSCFPLK